MIEEEKIKFDKKLSLVNVLSLAFGCIIGWGAFIMPGNTFLPKAGTLGTVIGMSIAMLIMSIIAINYNYMINKYPVSGGEFTYTYKTFGKKQAFFCVWFLVLSYAVLVPMNSTALALIGRNLSNNYFQFGFQYNIANYEVYFGELLLALLAIIIFGILTIRGVKLVARLQVILTFALLVGVLVLAITAIISKKITPLNMQPWYNPGISPVSGIISVLAVSPWAFVGFDTVPQSAEEFNFTHKKTIIIMICSIFFGGAVYIIINTITASVVPDGYINWVEYLDDLGNLSGLASLPTFNAAYKLLGNIGLYVIGISVLGAILSGIIGFYMATTRLLYSMSISGVIPKWFSEIHPKYKTPMNAIVFLMLMSIIAPFFGRVALGWLVDMSSLGAAIGYGYTSAAALKISIGKKQMGIMFTGVIGVIMSILFIIILLIPIPELNCSLSTPSYICLILWSIIGVVFYKISSQKRRKLN